MTRTEHPQAPLLERSGELALLVAALDRAADGRGGAVVIEGPAGIGKTRVLDATRSAAAERGFRVLAARASPLEREFGFGVVRGLLEPVAGLGPDDDAARLTQVLWINAAAKQGGDPQVERPAGPVLGPGGSGATPTFAALHGVYWLVAALAERGPLLLAVDDGHWADEPSLRALHHLARRIDHLPVLIVLTTRRPEAGADADLLDAVRDEPGSTVLRPAPLSTGGTAAVIHRLLGAPADQAFLDACQQVAEGNPLLLSALLGSLRQAGVAPTAAGVAAVHERAPGVVSAFVLPRLRHLPQAAAAVARALAVLGSGAALRHLAAVAGLDAPATAAALDQLAEVELITTAPVAFAHPLLGQAVLDRLPSSERLAGHQRAARELAADGAAVEAVAAHLLQLPPLRDPWVVDRLRAAARIALAGGAPQTAVRYLERALVEPPTGDDRVDVLAELGEAQCQAGPTTGYDRLTEALALAVDPGRRDRIALRLARWLEVGWQMPRALAVLDRAAAEIDARGHGDPDAALLVEAELIGLARRAPATRDAARARLARLRGAVDPASAAGRIVLANLAVDLLQEPGGASAAVACAERALLGVGESAGEAFGIGLLHLAGPVLTAAGELVAAAAAADRAAAGARHRGAPTELGAALGVRGDVAGRRGELLDAEADIRLALDLIDRTEMPYPARLLVGYLVPTLVQRGLLEEAERELVELTVEHHQIGLLAAIGRLRLAQDRPAQALDSLLACGDRLAKRAWTHPGLLPWRSDAAIACHRLDRREQATELATEALAEAGRYDAAIPLGIALRTAGLIASDLDMVGAAVDVLADTPARVEHAQALVEYGAALRRANHRADAREPLRAGLELAHRCAAAALTVRATEELAATGARPRTPLRTGLEALSPSERRVARLAADGRTNREIAQALFVTTKTVEVHLSAAYRKLGIAARAELAAIFD